MSYKQNASANRDALFGSAGGGGGGKGKKKSSRSTESDRDALFGGASKPAARAGGGAARSRPSSSSSLEAAGATSAPQTTSSGYKYGASKQLSSRSSSKRNIPSLSGEAKDAKMKEAKESCDKAKKAMQKGLFTKPDPLAASTYYKKASDAYQLCGEFRLERLYRISSADCQKAVGAFATAAAEYTRAAELLKDAEDEKSIDIKREIGKKLHLDAAEAWLNANEPAKAASSKVQAALALVWGDESSMLPKMALTALEESVEAHVPDPLNPYARYRQTGVSSFINPESDETATNPSPETIEFAKQHIVTRAYAHEPVQELVYLFVSFGEYASALYAAGAVTTILSQDSFTTLTLSRAFVAETILTLAMGDPIAAEENFIAIHVQKSSYLSSRECKLAEDLFRAIKMRDGEALEEARSPSGSNRAALANLDQTLRELVTMLRLSGVARKGAPEVSTRKPKPKPAPAPAAVPDSTSLEELASKKTGYEKEGGKDEKEELDPDVLQDELDALDFGDSDEDLSDDDFDLR